MTEVDNHLENKAVQFQADGCPLEGILTIPDNAQGIVILVDEQLNSRQIPRNMHVAKELRSIGLATMLFDLYTTEEQGGGPDNCDVQFDIARLGRRTASAVEWLASQPFTQKFPLGLLGSGSGAAASLMAAVECSDLVRAVVTRSGRPDLAEQVLQRIQAPTLMIVGSQDEVVLSVNQRALEKMSPDGPPKRIVIVPGASHHFEEAGTLDQSARMAREWFQLYFKDEAPAQ